MACADVYRGLLKGGDLIERMARLWIGLLACICLAIACYAVILRELMIAINWSDEVIKILFLYIVFMGTAGAYRRDGLVGISLCEQLLLKRRGRPAFLCLKLIQHLFTLLFVLFCIWQGIAIMRIQILSGEQTSALSLPAVIATLGFVAGAVIWSYFCLEKICSCIMQRDSEALDLE